MLPAFGTFYRYDLSLESLLMRAALTICITTSDRLGHLSPTGATKSASYNMYLRNLTYRYPSFSIAKIRRWSSAHVHEPVVRTLPILLHLLRQSLFVRPLSFCAMLVQSLREPWLTSNGRTLVSVILYSMAEVQTTYTVEMPHFLELRPLRLSSVWDIG